MKVYWSFLPGVVVESNVRISIVLAILAGFLLILTAGGIGMHLMRPR